MDQNHQYPKISSTCTSLEVESLVHVSKDAVTCTARELPGSIQVLCQRSHAVEQGCIRPRDALECIDMHSAGYYYSHGKKIC